VGVVSTPVITVVCGLLAVYGLLAVGLWRRGRRHPLERAQVLAAAREVDELELLYAMPACNPAWDAGRERLWDAVRDEQQNQKGDS
jgi:hypothetical protein